MIIDLMRSRDERPTLLLGDLHEWRLGGRSALSALDAAFGAMPVPVPSFPAGLPLLALDRIIANRPEILSQVAVHDTPLARIASDHLPIKAFVDPAMAALPVSGPDFMIASAEPAGPGRAALHAKETPLPLPASSPGGKGRAGSNRELVRKAGAQFKRAVKRTLRRPDAPSR